MRYALSRAALAQIRDFVRGRVLLAFDIDGTLAPIVLRPWDARIPDETQQELIELDKRATMAVVTGRAVADARPMLAFSPQYLIGNHGAEGLPGYERIAEGYIHICSEWLAALSDAGEAWREARGIALEDKTYSLAFHYRHAQDRQSACHLIEDRVARLKPLPDLIHGKCVVNLLPPGAPHKGDALAVLVEHCGCERALYVGDDVTDENVFRLRLPSVLTVRVERHPASAADLYLKSQDEVVVLMRKLREMLPYQKTEVSRQKSEDEGRKAVKFGRRQSSR